jgi:CubicO group peptidase (beta-lactamase class C family)
MKNTKKIKTIAAFFAFTFLISYLGLAQKTEKRVNKFIEYYNQQNYSKMKKSFFLIGRIMPLKKILRSEFEPRFKKYGLMEVEKVDVQSNKTIVDLKYPNSLGNEEQLIFYLNEGNKIKGLFFKNPDYYYKKESSLKVEISQPQIKYGLDSIIKHFENDGFNGNVLIVKGKEELVNKCIGYANFDTKARLNDSTMFELASCSKQFTAYAIKLLEKEGKLELTDSVNKYILDFPYKGITIEHLLSHTSGLPDYMDLLFKHWDKTKFATNYDVLDLLKKHKPKVYFKPNETFDYSNTGYAILSVIIEKVSGESYSEYLNSTIFSPLRMANTRVYNTRRSKGEKIENYAYGYVFSNKQNKYLLPDSMASLDHVKYMDAITGDGTVNTCVKDLKKFHQAMLAQKIFDEKLMKEKVMPHKLSNGEISNYNNGLFLVNKPEYLNLFYHGGSWPGYITFTLYCPDKKLSIFILSNNNYSKTNMMADKFMKYLYVR